MRFPYYDGKTLRRHYRKGLFFVVWDAHSWRQTYTLAEMRAWAKEAGGARLKRFLAGGKRIRAHREGA